MTRRRRQKLGHANVRYWRVADVGDIVKLIDEWKAASDD
jgi:hypothetical protein